MCYLQYTTCPYKYIEVFFFVDRHFSIVSSRALAGLVKTVVTSFMRRNHISLPDTSEDDTERSDDQEKHQSLINNNKDDIENESNRMLSLSGDSSAIMFDRLIFITVPLIMVLKDECISEELKHSDDEIESNHNFYGGMKQHVSLESSLQNMVSKKKLLLMNIAIALPWSVAIICFLSSSMYKVNSSFFQRLKLRILLYCRMKVKSTTHPNTLA